MLLHETDHVRGVAGTGRTRRLVRQAGIEGGEGREVDAVDRHQAWVEQVHGVGGDTAGATDLDDLALEDLRRETQEGEGAADRVAEGLHAVPPIEVVPDDVVVDAIARLREVAGVVRRGRQDEAEVNAIHIAVGHRDGARRRGQERPAAGHTAVEVQEHGLDRVGAGRDGNAIRTVALARRHRRDKLTVHLHL